MLAFFISLTKKNTHEITQLQNNHQNICQPVSSKRAQKGDSKIKLVSMPTK